MMLATLGFYGRVFCIGLIFFGMAAVQMTPFLAIFAGVLIAALIPIETDHHPEG